MEAGKENVKMKYTYKSSLKDNGGEIILEFVDDMMIVGIYV